MNTSWAEAWQTVVSTALLGTDRQPFRIPSVEGPLAQLLAQLDPGQPQAALLSGAALLTYYRQAGRQLAPPALTISQAAPETWPCCSIQSGNYLQALLEGSHVELLPEWLALAGIHHQRCPEQLLPALLERGRQQPALRTAIGQVIGARGHWLATLNPAWRYTAAPDPQADNLWETGLPEERLALLGALRQRDPQQARDLLMTTWATEAPAQRAKFLTTFVVNLSMADEPFLESCLDDRRKEVRSEAVNLLNRLTESRLVQRMGERLTRLLRLTGLLRKTVEVTLPTLCTPEMERDGIQPTPPKWQEQLGPRAWWLQQMLGCVPTTHWMHHFRSTPQQLLAAALRSEWREALLEGWLTAAVRHGEVAFLMVLADHFGMNNPAKLARIGEALPSTYLDQQLYRHLQSANATLAAEDVRLLAVQRHPWSQALSQAFAHALGRTVQRQSFQYSTHYELSTQLSQFALFIDPTTLADFNDNLLPSIDTGPEWERLLTPFLTLLTFRAEMHKSFG